MILRILVVEDDDLTRKLLCVLLEALGHETVCVCCAEDAMPRLEMEIFHIVITDYNMPGMNGIEFLKILKAVIPDIPVIGMSASLNSKEFFDAGAAHFISKPFELRQIKEAIENSLK